MSNKTKALSAVVAAFSLALVLCAAPKAARADDTTSVLLGAALGVAGTAIYENVLHKQQTASQVVGYTAQGCAVYADGHVGCNNANGVPTVSSTNGYGRYAGNAPYGYGRSAGNAPYGYGRSAATTPYGYGQYGGYSRATAYPANGRRTAESTYARRR